MNNRVIREDLKGRGLIMSIDKCLVQAEWGEGNFLPQ
jgi:hypothetical protein